MNPARENILRRVRQALAQPASAPPPPRPGPVWPSLGDLETVFHQEFTALRGAIIEDLPAFLAGFARVCCAAPIPADWPACVARAAGDYPLREADLAITGCDWLLARTGSVLLTSRSGGGRALSVLAPVHLVLARRSQLVPDLETALPLLRQRYGSRWPSMISVITGASRTADIEKVLVMGAHGPKRLVLHWLPSDPSIHNE